MTTEEVNLRHSLTDKEMAALAREQAEKLQSKRVAESEFESIRIAYKARITEAQAQVDGISARVQAGFEMKNIRCMVANERPEGYRLIIRLDTGHIAIRRKLETNERQIKLTEVNDPFVAVAYLPIDDPNWNDAEFFQCPVRQDEFDALRGLPDIKMADLKPVKAQLEAPKGKKEK
jgi:hypothetical protein